VKIEHKDRPRRGSAPKNLGTPAALDGDAVMIAQFRLLL
jgi:hypothetical protein